ncbi:transcriptional repressor TCF25-domain-containing protein [Xylaria nigripes]|nr:transcriptional repressor TCF25-domain-containing protein [Xylaria nigripes]
MSSRQLRKLQKQRELEQLEAAKLANDDSDASEDDAPIQRARPGVFATFAALRSQDDDDADDNGDSDDLDQPNISTAVASPISSGKPSNSSKKSKKKKKKKGKKPDNSANLSKADVPTRSGSDDIDEALRELNLSNRKNSADAGTQTDAARSRAYERICELLRINTYHLKVINEMRNLFGREAIANARHEENEENMERARMQRTRHMPQHVDLETFLRGIPGKSLPEVTLRRNPFLPGKESWPRASTEGLYMKQINKEASSDRAINGTVEFGFSHGENYNHLEQHFFHLVQMFDPMQLVQFLYRHPYHVSTLIQVSKVAKQDQNSALSADLCERALFTFGRVALSSFRQKMEEGKARLDFRRPENRQFWLAGYHYLRNLSMKGTYRTALEWAKLLFSMDLSDPYGLIHFIHPMAIRAHESKWFIDFCDSEVLDPFDNVQDYIRQTLVLARLQQGDTNGAKALLLEGIGRLPWLYNSIYKALNLDVPKAIWGIQPRESHEELFVELYLHQTKSLWDNAQATGLLKDVALEAKRPDAQTIGFPPVVGRNVARFVYLDNTPSLMAYVPEDLLSTVPNWEFDPIPPLKEENLFSYDSQQQPWMPPERRGLHGFDVPQDGQALRRLIARVRQGGAPPALAAFLQDAIAEADQVNAGGGDFNEDDNDDNADEIETDASVHETPEVGPGVFQVLMDLFNMGGMGSRGRGDDGGEGEGESQDGGEGEDEDEGEEDEDADRFVDHWNLADSELEGRMPGAWESDSDDGMAELFPTEEHNASGDATDHETSD